VIADGERILQPFASKDVAAFVGRLGEEGGPLLTDLHASDEMYLYERSIPYRSPEAAAIGYFATGRQIFRTIREIVEWRFGEFHRVGAFLDFASGYGRVTRFLVRAMAPQRIVVAEVDAAAVRFQEKTFGVRGVVSHTEPERLRLERSFDMVFAASFFSHLPERSFAPWLSRLRTAVKPGGLLAFSVHGMELLPLEAADRGSGIVFSPVSETERLDAQEYGTSYVTEEFVRRAAGGAGGPGDRLFRFPLGLCGLQDLYVLQRAPIGSGSAPSVSRCPLGTCDVFRIDDGLVTAGGWVEGDSGEGPPEVRLMLREQVEARLVGETPAAGARRRWTFSFPVSAVDPDEVVRIEAWSPRGASSILAMGSMRPYLPAAPR
jgi:SAM-dependent methyltransferase